MCSGILQRFCSRQKKKWAQSGQNARKLRRTGMSVSIKSSSEIKRMREAGRLLERVHDEVAKLIRPGISTWEIDKTGEELI